MIILDAHILGCSTNPFEGNTPLVVDANAKLN